MSGQLPPALQQGNAFACALGALIAALRIKGILETDEVLAIMEQADRMLPDSSRGLGAETLVAIRDVGLGGE